jgi:hypothetical protein
MAIRSSLLAKVRRFAAGIDVSHEAVRLVVLSQRLRMADLAARELQRFEAHARVADLEPLASRTFELHYPHAEDAVCRVQFRRASLTLAVKPQITPDGRVVLDLDIARDSVGEQTAAGPAITTRHVQTRVLRWRTAGRSQLAQSMRRMTGMM